MIAKSEQYALGEAKGYTEGKQAGFEEGRKKGRKEGSVYRVRMEQRLSTGC